MQINCDSATKIIAKMIRQVSPATLLAYVMPMIARDVAGIRHIKHTSKEIPRHENIPESSLIF